VNVPKPFQVSNGAPPALRSVAFQTRLTDAPGMVPLQFTSNAGDLTGQWSITRLANAAGPAFSVAGQLASQHLDLDMLLARPAAGTVAPAQSSPTSEVAPGPDGLLIPDTSLPFNLLRAIDANLKLALAAVRFHGVDIRKIDTVAAVGGGQLRVEPFTVAGPDNQRMNGKLVADATKTPPVVHLTVNAPALAVQPLLGLLGLPQVASGTAQVQADLTGTGESAHAIAASLDGWAGVAIEGGQLDTKMMNAWLDRVQPLHFSGPDVADLRCFALRADLKSGIATIAPVALNTPALIVNGDGDIDLGHETMALQVRPRAQIGSTGIAVPVRVSGPLRQPSATLDISAKGFGSGLTGLLLGGKNVMGAAGGGDPCPAALARAREAGQTEPPAAAPSPNAPASPPGTKP
jgi:AsmA protein